MIVRESIGFKRGIGSKASLGLGEKAKITKWLDEFIENNKGRLSGKIPFKYRINPINNEIKIILDGRIWGNEEWPSYILDNLDARSKFFIGIEIIRDNPLIKKAFDEGFVPSISSFKKFWSQILKAIGPKKFKDLILKLFPNRLPDDLVYLGTQFFTQDEREEYFSNPEFRESEDLIDRDEIINKQDYEKAEINLERNGFEIISTQRQRNNKTIMVESPLNYDEYTISIGGRLGKRGSTGSMYRNSKGTYIQMAQVLIDKINKRKKR